MQPLTVEQVAAVMCLTPRRIQQLETEGGGPPRDAKGRYPAREFGEWLKRRVTDPDKKRLLKAKADLAEMGAAELRGEVVSVEDVEACWGEMVTAFRARMLLIPPTLTPVVAPMTNAPEVQATIQRAVYEALTELAGTGVPPK